MTPRVEKVVALADEGCAPSSGPQPTPSRSFGGAVVAVVAGGVAADRIRSPITGIEWLITGRVKDVATARRREFDLPFADYGAAGFETGKGVSGARYAESAMLGAAEKESRVTASRLLDSVLAIPSARLAMNFYLPESDAEGNFRTNSTERCDRLLSHLDRVSDGDIVIVGEAPGWKGARQSGVPFTSAATVGLEGAGEASATIVQGMLGELGITDRVLLWNAFPLHPHRVGSPRTNRTPTKSELDAGRDPLRLAVAGRRVICVGNLARTSIEKLLGLEVPGVGGVSVSSPAVALRHPAHGGAPAFRFDLAAVGQIWDL